MDLIHTYVDKLVENVQKLGRKDVRTWHIVTLPHPLLGEVELLCAMFVHLLFSYGNGMGGLRDVHMY